MPSKNLKPLVVYLGVGEERDKRIGHLDSIAAAHKLNRSELIQRVADGDFMVGKPGDLAQAVVAAVDRMSADRGIDRLQLLDMLSAGELNIGPYLED